MGSTSGFFFMDQLELEGPVSSTQSRVSYKAECADRLWWIKPPLHLSPDRYEEPLIGLIRKKTSCHIKTLQTSLNPDSLVKSRKLTPRSLRVQICIQTTSGGGSVTPWTVCLVCWEPLCCYATNMLVLQRSSASTDVF